MKHHPACTWEQHTAHGEVAPGNSFWGELNYVWCQANCAHPPRMIDYGEIYRAAHGRRYSFRWLILRVIVWIYPFPSISARLQRWTSA